ncbi:hypothetical protein GUITHDRAFT_145001 [Guillardia theta CCMP2712]|uniref:Uncharacterized protein n=1 Tax=Guillardia theta (strain CCMP2712) TaxID=905079 RepID=L1ING5_GUITC|nr:hypothetical protein GUITHDRAFT_145001 [Guillardia theta CCMP2712]EKX37444.1 hypothetical protein GUITHDRAFT_145001 [Guillardia theta CCMP2712]|eukprot:XP_005824424.1 hypothetical protein GUITHDRAFT_145001 [Guillardia theta CCMP2712]
MGRARASNANKRLGILFARAVTADVKEASKFRSSYTLDRTGKLSLFRALSAFMPSAIRNECNHVGRQGLTLVEYNKCLEQNGFPKRWLNPKHCNDLKLLDAGWEVLKDFCPAQDLSTLKAKFLLVCQQFHDAWEEDTQFKPSLRKSHTQLRSIGMCITQTELLRDMPKNYL